MRLKGRASVPRPSRTRTTQKIHVHLSTAPTARTAHTTTAMIADAQRMPEIIEAMLLTNSGGGGDTVGFSCACRLKLWLTACVITPDIQNLRLRPSMTAPLYPAATEGCIRRVHGL